MKRFVSLFLLAATLLCFASCEALFTAEKQNNTTKKPAEYTTITVKGAETDYTYQVEIGERTHIELPIKQNFVCTGVYSAPEGGTKYFDEEGDATMVWQSNFPSVLYAQFKNVIGMTYSSSFSWEEDPHYISVYNSYYFTFTPSDEFLLAMKSNSSLDVKITITYEIIGTTRSGNDVVTYISSTKGKEGLIGSDTYAANYLSFTTRTLTETCKAKQLLKNEFAYFSISSKYGYKDVRVKNVACQFEILGNDF